MIEKTFGENFIFHANRVFKSSPLKRISNIYKKKLSLGEIPFHIFQSSEVYEVRYKVEDNTKSWDQLKREFSPNDSSFFKWLQLTQYQLLGKKILKGCSNTSNNPVHLNYHLAKGNHLFKCCKLNFKELCNIIILSMDKKPTCQKYFESCFQNIILNGILLIYYHD